MRGQKTAPIAATSSKQNSATAQERLIPGLSRSGSVGPRSTVIGRQWYPHPELNGDRQFRKLLLYPFELWGRPVKCYAGKALAPAKSYMRRADGFVKNMLSRGVLLWIITSKVKFCGGGPHAA